MNANKKLKQCKMKLNRRNKKDKCQTFKKRFFKTRLEELNQKKKLY